MELKINLIELDKRKNKVSMTIEEFKKLEKLAEIGKATEKAYEKGFCLIIGGYDAHADIIQGPFGLSIEGLLGLMEKEE